jgi:hypothetical protein
MECPDVPDGGLVYLDTNVFDPHHGITEGQEKSFLSSLRSRRLRIVFDLDCFFEPLVTLQSAAKPSIKARRKLERMLKWCDLRRIVIPAEWLLRNTILSFSECSARIAHFIDKGKLDEELERELKQWDSERFPCNKFLTSVAADVKGERSQFEYNFTRMLRELGPRDGVRPGEHIPTFSEFWEEHKLRVAESFVESIGREVDQSDLWSICCARGIDDLFDNKCFRLAVGVCNAFMYSHFYNNGLQIPRVRAMRQTYDMLSRHPPLKFLLRMTIAYTVGYVTFRWRSTEQSNCIHF